MHVSIFIEIFNWTFFFSLTNYAMNENDFAPLVAIMANECDVEIALHAVHNSFLNT